MVKYQRVLFITKTYTGFIKLYDMEHNTLIYAWNEFIVHSNSPNPGALGPGTAVTQKCPYLGIVKVQPHCT